MASFLAFFAGPCSISHGMAGRGLNIETFTSASGKMTSVRGHVASMRKSALPMWLRDGIAGSLEPATQNILVERVGAGLFLW